MDRQALIDRLTPPKRYASGHDAPLVRLPSAKLLFAATDTNAGYALLLDEQGNLLELSQQVLCDLINEARLYGVKLRNLRIFGKRGAVKRAPCMHFYPVDHLQEAA